MVKVKLRSYTTCTGELYRSSKGHILQVQVSGKGQVKVISCRYRSVVKVK